MLIDPGSELSFISEELVRSLKLTRSNASIPLLGIGGTYAGRTRGSVHLTLHSIHDSTVNYTLLAYILPRLTFQLPSCNIEKNAWSHLQGLTLADPNFGKPKPIHLILGADCYYHIIKPDIIQGNPSQPVAQRTIFGWIVAGPVEAIQINNDAKSYHCSVDQELQELLTQFWLQEEVSQPSTKGLTPEDNKCEEHFRLTHTRNETGRYIVRLPFKSSPSSLGNSTFRALRCLASLRQRFLKDPSYQELYTQFLQEYEDLGHMVKVPHSDIECFPYFYMPHHGVLRHHSSTTKLRVVFNGSSPSDNGISLNDILYAGTKLQTDISEVLLWFRRHRYVFTSDMVKMYRQIQIHPSEWDFQRIFWYNSAQQPVSYRLKTVTYGLKCAPYLALRVLQDLIETEGHKFPLAVPSLTRGRYVDDVFGGADSLQETIQIIEQLKLLCMAGGFPLQKWHSNDPDILRLSSTQPEENSTVDFEEARVKILGLSWHPDSDVFKFTSLVSPNRIITKRSVLSEIAQLYDPLGFIAPIIIRAKTLLQELWLTKVDWDDPLSEEHRDRWNNFRNQLSCLDQISIPRWIHLSSAAKEIELHGFCDASTTAMAAVIYARVTNNSDNVYITLICAKTKVAPIKSLTIPRLELTAAVILSRLMVKVQCSFDLATCPTFLWTDSAVTLHWLSSHPSKWKEFIRNRTIVIHEAVPNAIWKFVPGKDNPSDCATRGVTASQLSQHPLWWTGPPWLNQSKEFWPELNAIPASAINLEERPRNIMTTIQDPKRSYWELIERYSSLKRLLRITALCRRATARFRDINSEPLNNPLTPQELQQSCQFWIKHVQGIHFQKELKLLSKGELLSKSNSLIRLTPFLDGQGLIRVGGRLHHSKMDPNFKHPYILPKSSPLTTLIIADAHLQTLHGGTQVTLAYIRQSHWIVGGRSPVRSHILRCVKCARHRKLRAQQLMGQLPLKRITPSRPFLNTGVDYAGPFSIKTWRGRAAKVYKGYLAIFVCFSTSAVHLEVVTEYSTEAFIAAYKRFVSRRGICAKLYSDNGTNFVGADAQLRQLFNSASKELKELATLLANLGTEWCFIPPAAPHFGGKWEAAVKSVKFHLRRVIGDTLLTYEELTTLITQIEAILNSRPLCPMSDDSEDFTALTPGHFLIGEPLNVIPEPNLIDQPMSRLTRCQIIRQKVELFWQRWTSECLQRYQAITKWHHPNTEIKEGSLVLIIDERYPPTKWPLARVTTLHPGKDGLVRVVTLRTAITSFKRPISKICVLLPDTN